MNTTLKITMLGMLAALSGSLGNAQIIYSNNFALGAAVNISATPPTVANSYAGGTNNAVWYDVLGANDTGALLANGIDNTTVAGTSWVLPFTPQSNYIYLVTATVNFTNNPGNWIGFGFAQIYTNNLGVGFGRFADTVAGYDFSILTEGNGNVQYFAGPKAANTIYSANNAFTPGPGTNTAWVMLNTKTSPWSMASYINGVQMGPYFTYPNPSITTNIHAVGISQTTLAAPNAIQLLNFTLSTTLQPFITAQPTPAKTLGGGSLYTNSVAVVADTNGGPLSYQWYANNLPLTNGVNNVSGANTNILSINPISTANQFTNYYVVVTNNYGSATSSLASVTILTNPVVTAPVTSPTLITLFAGTGSYMGSSPSFSVTAIGAPPLVYQWFTDGAVVVGATNNSLAFTNCQLSSPANYSCVVSNSYGQVTNTWLATYLTTPTAAYPQAVLGDIPLGLWRLNESDDGNGNEGAVCHDYQSGANGVYTNVTLGNVGYNPSEPAETSMFVSAGGSQPSCVSRIGNVDLAATMTNGVNAAFAVEAWANCISGNGASGGAPVVSQGTLGASSFFLGVDTNSSPKHYQFYVRSAGGTLYSADDTTIQANDVNWHYLVGVCNEARTNVSLYIDGQLVASTLIPANSGVFESGRPVAIGAGIRPASSDYDVPFTGNIDDVAIYNHALSIGQVINHFSATGASVPVSFVPPLPPANVAYIANQTLTIPATVSGSGPFGYYWTDLTAGGVLASGQTIDSGSLDATLAIPNASASLSGDQLELVVTNATSSATTFVTLFNPAPPVTLDYTSQILYSNSFNGGTWSIAGMPVTAANVLVGGTSTTWVDELGTNDTGGGVMGNGTPATLQADSWVLPFTPHPGYIYTINASVTFSGNPGNWTGPGFAQNILTNGTDGRFNGGANGYDWMILTESSGNLQYFAGASTGGTITNKTPFFTAGAGTHTVQVILNTTGTQWKGYGFVDGIPAGTNTYSTKPSIGAVGITQNTLTSSGAIRWNYFALTQVAPGGVPPYLLSPLPPTNSIVLTNGTVTLPATAFGSAPFGYYWSDNSTVIASGSTNNMAPLPANLNILSSSLSPGQLQLVLTNAYGTNITLITLISPVNPNPGSIQYSVAGNLLTLSWPTNLGWTLQAQTNSLSVGIRTNWVNVANSSATNQVVIPVNPTNDSVFYRLILP